jgi:S1-C subfamily serine protease
VARFANDTSLQGGTADLALTFVAAGGNAIALHCTPGAVGEVGAPIPSGPASTMPSITSSPAAPSLIAGEPLLSADGAVLGILYDATPGSSPATFLPSSLVVGVANDLRSKDRVVHGWLGVQGTDAPDDGGATVAKVQSGGPAAGHLQAGQLIVAMNSTPVRSMAELRALLYVLPPGTAITLSVQQPAGPKVVDLTLGTSS